MNTGPEQKRFSVAEIAAGALAAVGLSAVIGVMMLQPQRPSPAATTGAAAAPPWDASAVVASPATLRQLPESGDMSRERQAAAPAAAAGVPPVPAPSPALAPPVTAMLPVESRGATALSGRLLDILRSEDPEDDAPPWPSVQEPPRRSVQEPSRRSVQEPPRRPVQEPPQRSTQEPPSPSGAERNPLFRSDATSIQRRLQELGYYFGDETGVWGIASRQALRDFKRMNGLQDDDKWDRATEAQLLSGPGVPTSRTFIGRWAFDADECRQRDDGAKLVIDARGAERAGGKCDFRSFKQESPNSWRIRAVCSASEKSWNANIGLKLNGPQLQWSSERGTDTYVRCPNSERAATSRASALACEIFPCGLRATSDWLDGLRPPWR